MLGLGPFGNARERLPFAAPFALRCRISFLMREASARSLAAVLRDVLRGAKTQIKKEIKAPSIVAIRRYLQIHDKPPGFQFVPRKGRNYLKVKRSRVAVVIEVLETIGDLSSYRRPPSHRYRDDCVIIFIFIICVERNIGIH
jgi:hypothetical protein